jgi:hypothetical protein
MYEQVVGTAEQSSKKFHGKGSSGRFTIRTMVGVCRRTDSVGNSMVLDKLGWGTAVPGQVREARAEMLSDLALGWRWPEHWRGAASLEHTSEYSNSALLLP